MFISTKIPKSYTWKPCFRWLKYKMFERCTFVDNRYINASNLLAIRNQSAYHMYSEVIIMARTATVFARVEPEVKEQAEIVLERLGIPMSNAVDMFLRQVVIQHGIPFEMKLPANRPLVLEELTKEQLDAELEKGFDDIENGRVYSADEVESELRKMFNR